jgi:hydroxymethylbilane synthase
LNRRKGAIAIEMRSNDAELAAMVAVLDHRNTHLAVLAERAFLRGMGGGCRSPIAGHARVLGHQVHLQVAVAIDGVLRFGEDGAPVREAERLGQRLAGRLLDQPPRS